jgi:hypothetical protein
MRGACLAVAAFGAVVATAPAATGDPEPSATPEVPLERLFKLPDSVATPSSEPRRGGKTRAEWQARFQQAKTDLETARRTLEETRKELEEVAPDAAWAVTAPGLPVDPQPAEKSIDFRLRQQIRRQREDVERAERRVEELGIEANLAEVPEDWRTPSDAPAPQAAPLDASSRGSAPADPR